MTLLINYLLKKNTSRRTSNRKSFFKYTFQFCQTNQQTRPKKFRIIGDVEIKVNNRTYDFSLTRKFKSKWSQNSVIRNFVRKWNKLQRVLRKEKLKKKIFKKKLKEEMLKRHEQDPMEKN